MDILAVSATVHRYTTGIATALSIIVAMVAVVDPAAFGVDVEMKAAVIAALSSLIAAVNVLRMRTDPLSPA